MTHLCLKCEHAVGMQKQMGGLALSLMECFEYDKEVTQLPDHYDISECIGFKPKESSRNYIETSTAVLDCLRQLKRVWFDLSGEKVFRQEGFVAGELVDIDLTDRHGFLLVEGESTYLVLCPKDEEAIELSGSSTDMLAVLKSSFGDLRFYLDMVTINCLYCGGAGYTGGHLDSSGCLDTGSLTFWKDQETCPACKGSKTQIVDRSFAELVGETIL